MKRNCVIVAGTLALIGSACTMPDAPSGQRPTPEFTIQDGRHSGGNPRFFFLPPLVSNPHASGVFDPSLTPTVRICEVQLGACTGAPIAAFDKNSGTNGQVIVVDPVAENYSVNWSTRGANLDPSKTYRIMVEAGGLVLGFADVDVVSGSKELKNIDDNEFIGLIDGHILVIKFRAETGIFPLMISPVSGDGQSAAAAATLSDALTVHVTDASGYPAAGVPVNYSVTVGGGSISPEDAITDASGFARGYWTLGSAGSQEAQASLAGATGSPVTFHATVLPTFPAFCGQSLALTGGQMPAQWTQVLVRGGPGLVNDRLEALPTDGGARIGVSTTPGALTKLTVDFDGLSNQSVFGTHHGVNIVSGSTILHFEEANASFNFGAGNLGFRLMIRSALWPFEVGTPTQVIATDIRPYDPGPQHFRLEVTGSNVVWTVVNTQTNRVVTSTQLMPLGFAMGAVSGFHLFAYETTGSGTWADNIQIACQ
jgi:hypothetical protein